MKDYTENPFVFAPRYRLLRHLTFWAMNILVFSFLYKVPEQPWLIQFIQSTIWVVAFIIYCYPVMFILIPNYLLKGKLNQFFLIALAWAVAGYFFNYLFRRYVFFNLTQYLNSKMNPGFAYTNPNPWAPAGYIVMNLMAGFGSMVLLFKFWVNKQKDYLNSAKEKVNAELQLLKAQIHPHFLFNTLNNIYAYSLRNSSETSQMILKLSSLLSYMLYDCMENEVLLEKEIDVMKNYIDLEKERHVNLEVSLNFEGDIRNKWIAPLLLLPFLENAFKHGIAEQFEKSWISMDIAVRQNLLRAKISNSKDEMEVVSKNGIGIENVKKRLDYLYPGKHTLKISDEGDFFVVNLFLDLDQYPSSEKSKTSSIANAV